MRYILGHGRTVNWALFGRHYSFMLLALMSIEKCFTVYYPLKSKTVCTVKTAKWATGIVGVILAGYDSVYFVAFDTFIKLSGNKDCFMIGKYIVPLWSADSILYSFGPLALMLITNASIVFKFMRAKCKSNSTRSTNQALIKSATRGDSHGSHCFRYIFTSQYTRGIKKCTF